MRSSSQIQSGKLLLNYLRFTKIIGQGAFGEVWEVLSEKDQKKYACKVEKQSQRPATLSHEAKIIMTLMDSNYYSKIVLFGHDSKNNYLIMDLMSSDLENYRVRMGGKLPQPIVMHIAFQMIEILEDLHKHGIVHRDIKPENIAIKNSSLDQLFLIDFGLAKVVIDQNGKHVPFAVGKGMTGTVRYACYNALNGYTQSRRDDLESLFYTLMYLMEGTLPWIQGYKTKELKKIYISQVKESLKPECMPEWSHYNPSFFKLFHYARKLDFTDKPDYAYLKDLFKQKLTDFNEQSFDFIDEIEPKDLQDRNKLMVSLCFIRKASSNHFDFDPDLDAESSENFNEEEEGFINFSKLESLVASERLRLKRIQNE